MPAIGKETERQLTPEEMAEAQIDGYIERIEKQTEISGDVAKYVQPTGQVTLPKPITDDYGQVVMDSARKEDAPINLPLTEEQLQKGLHHKVFDSVRWLAETCVYLIKKYPGRVFYPKQ